MMYLSPLTVHICSVLDEQLAYISVAFFSCHHERSRGVLSKIFVVTDILKKRGSLKAYCIKRTGFTD
jgi:hypothetical protein